ncbi:MAG: cysteine desulfurase-like protein [Acidiferrobacterales bacterium]
MGDKRALDVDFVRSHFSGLNGWAFLENAGGTLVPQSVIERIQAYMTETQVQPGSPYPASALAAERIAHSQRLMAEMINASPEEVVIGPSTTMNIYVLAQALWPWFRPGDEVIVTNLDHEANGGAWRRLAERGVIVKEWLMDPETAELEIERLADLLTNRTRLVCFTQCSNITGSINDVAAITQLVHEAGALVCVDAVAYAPHRAVDVKALDVDFYVFSAYKVYGPHLGLLYGKRGLFFQARGQNHYFIGEKDIPLKLIPGGLNHELTAGLCGVIDYFDALYRRHFDTSNVELHQRLKDVFALIASHEDTLTSRFLDFLNSKPGVRLIGKATADHTKRAPVFSFVVGKRDSMEFPAALAENKIAISAGSFYAQRCIEALGLASHNGVVRVSMVHYNTVVEVNRLIEGLDPLM